MVTTNKTDKIMQKNKVNIIRFFLFLQIATLLFQGCSNNTEKKQKSKKQNSYTILGLGDSITEGNGTALYSYLFPLWKKLLSAGYETEFIGPNVHKCHIGNIMNAGYGGKNAEYLDTHIDSIYTKYTADIVLLHAGHNHFNKENPIEGIVAAQKSIISKIVAINPDVKIFVAQVITSGKLPKYSYIPELNKQTYHLVEQLKIKGLPVTIVNQAKDFNWKTHCLTDKVHPNFKGAEVMADTWFNAINKELKKFTDTNKY
jgi:acetyl esterase